MYSVPVWSSFQSRAHSEDGYFACSQLQSLDIQSTMYAILCAFKSNMFDSWLLISKEEERMLMGSSESNLQDHYERSSFNEGWSISIDPRGN